MTQPAKTGTKRMSFTPGKTYSGHKAIALVAVGCRATVCVATKVKQLKSKKSRHRMCSFECAHCKFVGLTRFKDLVTGETKSCGCLESAAFFSYHRHIVINISGSDLRKMFEDRRVMGADLTSAKWGVSKYVLDFAVAEKYERLGKLFPHVLNEISAIAQKSPQEAMVKFKKNLAEVTAVCRIVRQRQEAAKVEAIAAWHSMPEAHKSEIKAIIAEGKPMIREAVELATGGHKDQPFGWFEEGRYWGELSPAEYSTCDRYSYFGWAAEVVCALPVEFATTIFGTSVGKFIEIVQQTESGRSYRRKSFKNKKETAKSTVKRSKSPVAKRGIYFFPAMSGKEIASRLTTYALAA